MTSSGLVGAVPGFDLGHPAGIVTCIPFVVGSATDAMNIPRLQLLELEDQSWLPPHVRDLATDYLHFMESRFRLHLHALPVLARAIRESEVRVVVDLCSGGAGPVPTLLKELGDTGVEVRFVLTDLYPNRDAFARARREGNGLIDFVDAPVDARRVPAELVGLRTFFNAFHHFSPTDAVEILSAAAASRQPIAVLEVPQRSLPTLLPLVFTPVFVWLATPFVRPFMWSRLLFTYLLPLVPLVCLWDGIVSQLRAYHPEELRSLADRVDAVGYVWETGTHKAPSVPGRVTYLLGRPV